ncbi:MAG: alanine:cation symporter family protein [Deltaproteobacteria bacterium]|nr:alanine:cation symporter family protein [Deltaproteobacteria bacterium]
MGDLQAAVDWLSGLIWNTPDALPFMVILLLFTGLFLTVRMGFIQVRRLGHSVRVVMGRYDDPDDAGDVTHFQALSSALSATVGIGNIAGVATAIHYGGPGAVFWLWVTGFIGMASKFTECTLAQKYRVIHEDGSVSGGPMYYIEKAFGSRWKWLAVTFAACAVVSSFGSGNSIQAFTMADSFRSDFGIPNWISGLVSTVLVGMVIIGGIRRIGLVASRLVPLMGGLYVLCGLLVVALNLPALPEAVATIVGSAFSTSGMIGGFAGSTFIFTLTWGVKRGLFSNEAGQGSAPIAHAAAKTDEPVREGAVALMEPFIDTVVVCFMTGLIIVLMGTWDEKHDDAVTFTPKSSLTVVMAGSEVQPNGGVLDVDRFQGEDRVVSGRLQTTSLVRNHSIMDDCRLEVGGAPMNGLLRVGPGGIVTFEDGTGQAIPGDDVIVQGRNLLNGSPLTAASFKRGLAPIIPFGNLLVTIAVFLFAISTAISWSYYGDRAAKYLFGEQGVLPYRVAFLAMHFLGAVVALEVVWGFGDAALGLMAIPNLFTIMILSGQVKKDSDDYFQRMDRFDRGG